MKFQKAGNRGALPVVRVPRRLADGIAVYKKFGETVIQSAGIKIDD